MTKKQKKILTPEEKWEFDRKRELSHIERELPFINEPTYFFEVGDKVAYGALKECTVKEVLHDGKIYVLDCIATNNNYGKPIESKVCRATAWHRIRPLGFGDTNFTKNDNIRIRFYNSTIESLLSKYYVFGVELSPEYQRGYVWSDEDKEYLLDSIFNNIDIGKFAFVQRDFSSEKMYEILDGKQRLSTIIEFYENRIPYKGAYFNDLSAKDRRTFIGHEISYGECENSDKKQILSQFLSLNRTGRVMSKEHLDKVSHMLDEMEG